MIFVNNNLDYECALFDSMYSRTHSRYLNMVREFEYIFFIINEDENLGLNAISSFSKDYLMGLNKRGFKTPILKCGTDGGYNWWGPLTNLELERKLNLKLTSEIVAKKLNVNPDYVETVYSNQEILKFKDHYKDTYTQFLLRKPDLFSGIGHIILDDQSIQNINFNESDFPMIMAPYLNRIVDIGSTFFLDDGGIKKLFTIINNNSARGQFLGGIGFPDANCCENYLENKFHISKEKTALMNQKLMLIVDEYFKLGARGFLQIDSFYYEDGKMYPLVEVNCRRTMGQLIHRFANHFQSIVKVDLVRGNSSNLCLNDSAHCWSPNNTKFKVWTQILKHCSI